MNQTASSARPETSVPSCESLKDTLVGLGTSWAAYGLQVSKLALATTAETLGKTAETLDALAASLKQKAAAAAVDTQSAQSTPGANSAPDAPASDPVS